MFIQYPFSLYNFLFFLFDIHQYNSIVILQAGDNCESILLNNFKLNILNSFKPFNFPVLFLLVSSFRALILNTLEHLVL